MFSIPGIALLVAFIYIRPQEYFTALQSLPLLYLFFGLALFGFAVDLRMRLVRPQATPQLLWVVLYYGWCLVTLAVREPSRLQQMGIDLLISIALYLLIGHAIQTFRALQGITGLLLTLVLFLSFVGVHQGNAPFGCHVIDETNSNDESVGVYDGRECTLTDDCYRNDPEPGAHYMCERIGLFGTHSVGKGRVRYMGPLQDPNELALAIGIAMPFAIGFAERRRRSWLRKLLLGVTIVLVGLCIVYTQSRGGQLVFVAALGAYFVKRYGVRGMLLGAVVALPMLMLGGREGEEAAGSSQERLECWYEGMSMWREKPFMGVGTGRFTDHHFLTAHNSYVLAPAETGIIGMFLWSMVLYMSVKSTVKALGRLSKSDDPASAPARTWAMAILASQIGLLVGIFFLSFCYHQVLWIWIGVAAAFYQAMKTHDPEFEVECHWRDLALVFGLDLLMIAILFVYTRLKV
jgi:O-antigen ligase